MTTCPKCGIAVGNEADSCSACGILFSKWVERNENVLSGNMARYTIANATSSEFNWTILVIFCAVIASAFFFLQHSQ